MLIADSRLEPTPSCFRLRLSGHDVRQFLPSSAVKDQAFFSLFKIPDLSQTETL